MKGYDFGVLESYQSFVHNLAENMGVNVSNSWVTPAKSYMVNIHIAFLKKIAFSFFWLLNLFQRNLAHYVWELKPPQMSGA